MTLGLLRRRKDLPLSHLRLIALALLAVLLPAVVLLYLQYQSLFDVEQKTHIAVQENLREAAEGLARNIQGDMGRVAEEILLPAPARFFGQRQAPWTEAQIQKVVGQCSEIRKIFLIVDDPKNVDPDHVAYVYFQGKTSKLPKSQWSCDPEVRRLIEAHQKADLLVTVRPADSDPRTRDLVFWQDPHVEDAAPDQQEAVYVMYCLVEPGTSREVGVVGVQLDMRAILQTYLPEMVSYLSRSHKPSSGHPDLVLGILDQHGNPICSSAQGEVRYVARATLAPVFPQWQATAGFRSTDIDALAHASFQKGLWFTTLVAAVLLVGIALIVRAAAREVKLAEVKQTFVSNVSHELKTPLALIRLFAETLEMGRVRTSEKTQEYYRVIHNESRRLSQLIDNILDFSRIEAGSRQYRFASVDLAEVAREVVESYEYQIHAAGFELVTRFEAGLPRVEADANAISQAILNLLNNAVKYSDRTKHITVSARPKEGGVAVEVADQGIGIPLSEQKRIFEKFYRVGTGLVHETKGSGLGLALVKHIVEAHRGHVSVESAPGKGSRFILWLPAVVPSAMGLGAEQTEPAPEGDFVVQALDHRR